MPIVNVVMTTAKIVTSSYRILATVILGYFLVRDSVKRHRKYRGDK